MKMSRAFMIVMDGLRRDLIDAATTPRLHAFVCNAQSFSRYRSVFPSTTRVAAASLATGCLPMRHGLQGNNMALREGEKIEPVSAGAMDFLDRKRRATNVGLAAPTLAERVKPRECIAFSNVSAGAARVLDPDGAGYVYHRAGSFGPGRTPVPPEAELRIEGGADGDHLMAHRFVLEVARREQVGLGIIWFSNPDHAQHRYPLGSKEHLAALRDVDQSVGFVLDELSARRSERYNDLLIVCSDHGQRTIAGVVDVNAELAKAKLAGPHHRPDVVAVSNGTGVLVYLEPSAANRISALWSFFDAADWVNEVYGPSDLSRVGQSTDNGLAFALSLKVSDEPNEFGVRGIGLIAEGLVPGKDRIGCGQHGGLGDAEQSPFLSIRGGGFTSGAISHHPASLIDVAPTILRHLGLSWGGMDGTPLLAAA